MISPDTPNPLFLKQQANGLQLLCDSQLLVVRVVLPIQSGECHMCQVSLTGSNQRGAYYELIYVTGNVSLILMLFKRLFSDAA